MNVPNNENMNAKDILTSMPELANKSIEIKIPSFADSIVPAVVGDTNEFWLSFCMIKPAILKLAPAIRIVIKRGTRLTKNTCNCLSVNSKRNTSLTEMFVSPTNREITDKIMRMRKRCHFLMLATVLHK